MKQLKRRLDRLGMPDSNAIAIVIVRPGMDREATPIEYDGITYTAETFAARYPEGRLIYMLPA